MCIAEVKRKKVVDYTEMVLPPPMIAPMTPCDLEIQLIVTQMTPNYQCSLFRFQWS